MSKALLGEGPNQADPLTVSSDVTEPNREETKAAAPHVFNEQTNYVPQSTIIMVGY